MPITVEITDAKDITLHEAVFSYFHQVDARFSPYKEDSELSKLNNGLAESAWSDEMKQVISLCEETTKITGGYFNIKKYNKIDPSGLVKGWAIDRAARMLLSTGSNNFYIEAGGDIQAEGLNTAGQPWSIGIRNPFDISQIVKVINVSCLGVATSGPYIRGEHIYNPLDVQSLPAGVKSLTVLGPNIFEADRFATAAFAMGEKGVIFIEALPGFEAYMIADDAVATYTAGFDAYVA